MQVNAKQDKEAEIALYKNRIIYSLPVHAGEWLNALATREQQESLHLDRRNHCELIIQKTRKMFRNLLRPTVLVPESAYVNYHQQYQIRSYGVPFVTSPCNEPSVSQSLVLSGIITEREIDSTQHFVHGCLMSASPTETPSVRNTFIFVNCASDKTGPVAYGDDIFIQIVASDGLPLYVQCENSTMDSFGTHLSLRLSQSPDIYCRFKIHHWKPELRYETNGTSVLFNTHVVIQHAASGRNLAAENAKWIPTFFGPECVVSCHTFRDTHKMETVENLWRIVGDCVSK